MTVRKKDRFEVFKRDSFTCQYCGRSAPDVILQVDHIKPVSKGGADDITNLVTSCWECNIGKGGRELSDDSVVKKQQAQLAQLQERREQIEMMMDWQRSLMDMEQEVLEDLASIWDELTPGRSLNQRGLQRLNKLIREYSYSEIADAMRVSAAQYLVIDDDGDSTEESAGISIRKLRGICYIKKQQETEPYIKDLLYIRGIVRNRCTYCKDYLALQWLREAAANGCEVDILKEIALSTTSWTNWKTMMSEYAEVS